MGAIGGPEAGVDVRSCLPNRVEADTFKPFGELQFPTARKKGERSVAVVGARSRHRAETQMAGGRCRRERRTGAGMQFIINLIGGDGTAPSRLPESTWSLRQRVERWLILEIPPR